MNTPILTVLFALALLGSAEGRDLYVVPNSGDDSNDGATQPLKSIKQAIRLAEPGDTIHLKPMVYYEYAGFYSKRGEPGKPITLDGHGATLEGSDPIVANQWAQVSPGLFKNNKLMPSLDKAILSRWFFLFDGKINRMGRVLKGASKPFLQPSELKPGEWTFVEAEESHADAASDHLAGEFFIKIAAGQTLEQANIRFPARSAGVQFGGDNAQLIIRNLTATHAYNDGFNIHGDCRDVVFENIQAVECGDDGISAHETAQYRVDGFVSLGNGTGICDTGGSQTSYNRVFIADCVGVDLYFLDTGRYSITNCVVLSVAQKPMVVAGRGDRKCTLAIDNLYMHRMGPPQPAIVASKASVTAVRMTLERLDLRITGEITFEACLINGRPHPIDGKSPGADVGLLDTVVPRSQQFRLHHIRP